MVNTLADVEDAVSGRIDPVQSQLKHLKGWLVGSGLLCGDDFIEVNPQLGASPGK